MYRMIITTVLAAGLLVGAGPAVAGKADGSKCKSSKSCSSGNCEFVPGQRFGTCCVRDTCPSLSAECGTVADGCGGLQDCGQCADTFECDVDNTCQPTTICGWTKTNGLPTGSYQETCDECSVDENCVLSCTCLTAAQDPNPTQLDLDGCSQETNLLENVNGILTCYNPSED